MGCRDEMIRKIGHALCTLLLAATALTALAPAARAQTEAERMQAAEQRWADLATAVFPGHTLKDGSALLALDLPVRAEDAAVVPLTIRTTVPPGDSRQIRRITVVIDANPSPVAATFTLGDNAGVDRISTRIRVDDYTYVHAIAETADGDLYVARAYVKAAGGCSAPASKTVQDGRMVGAMRVRLLPPDDGSHDPAVHQAQLLVNHPNYSGMQMDQVTRLYVPAYFVRSVTITQGERTLLSIDSGISIAENPEYRFDFRGDGHALHVTVNDSRDQTYTKDVPAAPPS
jgi:sulfur-oxidizing protein SoxY